MSLTQVFAAISERMPSVRFLSPRQKDEIGKPPRIMWRPVSHQDLNPQHTGGGPGDDGPVMQRQWSVAVQCWGEDLDKTEDLADAFMAAAFHQLSRNAMRLGDGVWDPGTLTDHGVVCVINLRLVVPVLRERPGVKVITAINMTYDIKP